MSKNTLVLIITLFILNNIQAQKLRHVEGNVAIDVSIHLTDYAPAYSLVYTHFFKDDMLFKVKLNYEKGLIGLSNYTAYLLSPTVAHTPLKIKSSLFLNFELGGIIGVEQASNPEYVEEYNTFLYGVNGGVEAEYYFLNNIAVLLNINELITQNSKFGNARYQIGFGLRLIIK